MKRVWLIIVVGLLCSSEFLAPHAAAQDQASIDPAIEKSRKIEAYIAPYLLGTFPVDKYLSIGGNGFTNETFRGTNIKGSGGAGLKAGVYPGARGGGWDWKANFSATAENSRLLTGRFRAQMQIY